jgi:hypothetical protein
MIFVFSILLLVGLIVVLIGLVIYISYRNSSRELKNYERGLKMVSLLIHLPPSSDDIEGGGRDKRDVVEETIAPAEIMYNILASTAAKGFKTNFYGQKHIGFEVIAVNNSINYYVAAPVSLVEVIEQAVTSAYPSARVEEVEEYNLFNAVGKIGGTIGGEIHLAKEYAYPIATFQETKRDTMMSLLNSLVSLNRQDGVGLQILIRPAHDNWAKNAKAIASNKKKGGKSSKGLKLGNLPIRQILEAPFKVPEWDGKKDGDKPKELSSSEQSVVEAIESKTQHPGFEVLIRLVVSSNTSARAQSILNNLTATFALYNSEGRNGLKFNGAKDIEKFVTSFIFRFFPQEMNKDILNSIELATLFHLPDQKSTPTSQLKRQASKQVDGPSNMPSQGQLMGFNLYRGIKKEVRITPEDRLRHMYIVGQTGTGKSTLLKNLMLQDMLDGKGFAYLDPHGQDLEELMGMVPKSRVDDVIYFSPSELEFPVGLNMFEFPSEHPEQKDFLIQEAISMLYELYDPNRQGMMGARFEQLFRNAALTAMADPQGGTIIDLPKLFVDKDYLESKLKYVTAPDIIEFWRKEMPASAKSSDHGELISWFSSKIGAFRTNEMMRNIVGQLESGIKIREAMDEGKIIFINLNKGKTGDINARLLGMIFLTKFTAAAMSRSTTNKEELRPFTLYVDEFQNFLTDSVKTILSEARKYKLSIVMANQYVGQLTEEIKNAVFGNVGSLVSLRTGPEDADVLVKQFDPVFSADDLIKMPNLNGAVKMLVGGIPTNPFTMFIPFPEKKSNPEITKALKRLSASKYSRPKSEVEKEIYDRMKDNSPEGASPGASAQDEIAAMKPKSFLDDFMAKRGATNSVAQPSGVQNLSPAQPAQPAQNKPVNTPSPLAEAQPAQPVELPAPPSIQDGVAVSLQTDEHHTGEFSIR